MQFETAFRLLSSDTGDRAPFPWQARLFSSFLASRFPDLDVPTGLGKTSVMTVWLIARALGARVPTRLIYVVDRRAVVDQATTEADHLARRLGSTSVGVAAGLAELRQGLGLAEGETLAVSTLRGQHADNQLWRDNPARPAIIVGTVDMIGSRLLFEGYGVGFKSRPIHAGLIGADSLIVLDEAHLVPAFERLIEAVARDVDDGTRLGLRAPSPVPALAFMSLSATGRDRGGDVLRLEASDLDEPVVRQRVEAAKAVHVAAATPDLSGAVIAAANALTENGARPVRLLIYLDKREDSEKVADGLAAAWGRAAGKSRTASGEGGKRVELLVGARRVRERTLAEDSLRAMGFVAGSTVAAEAAVALVATSAGEVGIDLDADHLICDAVPFERMVQRLGRVNRRGTRFDTQVHVIPYRDDKRPANHQARLDETIALLARLPRIGDGPAVDAGPGNLGHLRAEHAAAVARASTPAPLRPALTRPLVEAWSMTSLREHTGRPEVAPWLRGWVDETLNATVVWRDHLPFDREGEIDSDVLDRYLDAAPIEMTERLETEAWRVSKWLFARSDGLTTVWDKATKRQSKTVDEDAAGETDTPATPDPDPPPGRAVAIVMTPDGKTTVVNARLAKSDRDRKRLARDFEMLDGLTVLAWSGLGGVTQGLLDAKATAIADAADGGGERADGFNLPVTIRRGEAVPGSEFPAPAGALVLDRDDEGEAKVWLEILSRPAERLALDDDRSAASPRNQSLQAHLDDVAAEMRGILAGVRMDPAGPEASALMLAARLHDVGKAARRWQAAFRPRSNPDHVPAPFAKTNAGRPNFEILGGYRHELGSLLAATTRSELAALPADEADLVAHLIAAHHGHARPTIAAVGDDELPPSVYAVAAGQVALRFARLQRRYGPWGLAWLEALLRAADQRASRALGTGPADTTSGEAS